MGLLKQGTAYLRMFYLGGSGLGPAASISKNGAAFSTPAGGAGMTDVGSSWYSLQLQAADTDTVGDLAYSFSNGTMSAEFRDQVTVNGPEGGSGLNAAATRAAIGLADANLDEQLGEDGFLGLLGTAIEEKTTNLPASPAGVGAAMTLTSGERTAVANALLDQTDGVETGVSPRGALKVCLSGSCGLVEIDGDVVTLQNFLGTKDRVIATTDAVGRRLEVEIDVS